MRSRLRRSRAGPGTTYPKDFADVLGFVDPYAHKHPDHRVVWFADVTRWLEWERDSSWSALGVDWEYALTVLMFPGFGGAGLVDSRARRL
jgi:hypothetical protein